MITTISPFELNQILTSYYKIDVEIDKNYKYYEINNNYFHSIVSSNNLDEIDFTLIDSKINYASFGVPIILIKNLHYSLAPTLLDFVIPAEFSKIGKDQIDKVTRGLRINLEVDNGTVIVTDDNQRKIALGNVISGKFDPIVDLGWYLRAEG